ncbi:LCP family protein [Negativibacillus massiliensis]|uniref:LCP family protein n=1 Tax=Negativibacillus massiliensis TaxID=1871035 RepID=UPI003AF23D64
MPQVHIKKRNTKKIFVLIIFLLVFVCVVLGVFFWESKQKQEAMLVQAEIDEPARKRREGWVERDGVWYAPKQDQETMLLIGMDKMDPLEASESYNNNAQSDFLLLAIFDNTKETTTLLHINRDTMAQIPVLGVTGQPAGSVTGQLALAHTYGSGLQDSCVNTVNAVSDFLYGIKIDHYVAMTMGAVPYINDLVGGVPVTVLDDFSGIDDSLVEGETITLKGEQALHYVRVRGGLEDSSNLNRMKRQQQYLESMAEQIGKLDEDFSVSPQQISTISKYIISDCSIDTLSRMAEQFVDYPLQEMQDIQGEAIVGEEYMEFYADEAALQEQILDLFYEVKE